MYTSLREKTFPDSAQALIKDFSLPASDALKHLQTFKLLNSEAYGRSLLKIIINFESNISQLSLAFNSP